jgi:hypothetical protein
LFEHGRALHLLAGQVLRHPMAQALAPLWKALEAVPMALWPLVPKRAWKAL